MKTETIKKGKMIHDIKNLKNAVSSNEYQRLIVSYGADKVEDLTYGDLIQLRASLSQTKYQDIIKDQQTVQKVLEGKTLRWMSPTEFHFSYWSKLASHEIQLIEIRTGKALIEDVYIDDDGDDDEGYPIYRHLISYKLKQLN